MSLPSKLDVPLVYQENDSYCTPACIKMVLEFIEAQNPEGFLPSMDIDEIAEAIGTDELGTPLENIENINKELERAVPSVEFKAEMNCSFKEIEDEILQGRVVIAWIYLLYNHSVVVTGMNKDLLKIYCNDPESGKREMEMGEFISAWRGSDNVLIKVKIGGKLQRIMPEYADETQREPQ